MSGEIVAHLDAVARRHGRASDAFELAPTTLTFAAGSLVAIGGRTGSGKTTLLHLLSGLDRPDSGRVHLFGRDVTNASESALARLRREHVGILHQHPLLLDHLPVWQNVAARFVPLGLARCEQRAAAERALAAVGLAHTLDRRPRELSGGEQQRVALARALVSQPQLLIADEPTAHVDAETAARIADLLLELRSRGAALVVSTHDPQLAARADRQIVLVDGRVRP